MQNPTRSTRLAGLLAVLLCCLALGPAAQGDEQRVSVQLSTGVARLGESVYLVVTVENAGNTRFVSLPEVEGLAIGAPRGPETESRMSWVNGRRTGWVRERWTLSLRPSDVGDYEIPPLVLQVDGKEVSTRGVTLRVVRDVTGADLGFLELVPSPTRVVEGQPFRLELRFGWDAEARVNLADLLLPWWGELSGVVELASPDQAQSARTVEGVTVNGRVRVLVEETAPRSVDGREFRSLRLVKTYLPGRPGTLEFPRSFLEFGELQSGGPFQAARKKTWFAEAPALSIEVVPLPSEGQPFDYSGAVGSLAVRASADTRDVVVGDSIKLDVVWSGSGNLEFFQAPDLARLDAFDGFRVYGRTEEKSVDRRAVTYDLAPLSDAVTAIPPVELSVFDPATNAYETLATEPIPIRVRALEGRSSLLSEARESFAPDVRDIDPRPLSPATDGGALAAAPSDRLLVLLLFAVPAVWLALRAAVRHGRGDPDAPLARRRRRARRVLERDLRAAASAEERLAALTRFLAARAGEPEQAWVGRDPRVWLRERGAHEGADVERLCAVVERLEEATWGGGATPVSDAEILAAADQWQRALRPGVAA